MKNLFSKLMMVLLIALFALPAQAKFYATGDANYATATGATAWGGSPNAFELNEVSADSHYTLIMNVTDALVNHDITLRLSTSNSSSWNTTNGDTSGFNNNAWGIDSGTTNQIVENKTHAIKKHGTDGTNLKFKASSTGKYILDITDVNMTAGTANVKVYKQPDLPETLYIGMEITSSGWTFGTPMESKGNGVFEYTFTNDNKNPFYFLISAASTSTPTWSDTEKANFYGPESGDYEITTANGRMNVAQKVTKGKGNVFKMTEDGTYKVTVNLTDATNGTVTVSPVQSSSASYCLKTSADNWNTTIDLTGNGDGTYSCTMNNPAEGLQFMVQKNGSDFLWPTSAVTYSGGEQTINLGTTDGQNITMGSGLSGKYTITLNPDAKTLTIKSGSTPTPSTYSYQLKGTIFDGSSWQTKDMTENNGAWEWKGTVTSGSFGIRMMEGSDQKAWIWSADKSTISAAGVFSAIQESNGNGKNWSSDLEGEYTFSFNPTTMKLTISGGSSIPTVSYRLKYSVDSWSTSKYSDPLTDKGDGTFVYTINNPVEGLQFMVQKSTDSGKSYVDFCWPAAGDKDYKGDVKTFTMSGDFGNNVTFGAGLTGDYTLTFTPNETATASTLKISGASVAAFGDVYLTGSFNGWKTDKDNDNYKFTTNNGKIYTLTSVNLNLGSDPVTMKVYKGGTYYGYDKATVVGPVKEASSDKNIELTKKLVDATITFDITDATKPVIKIFNPNSVYLHGDFTDPAWKDNDEYKFSTTDNQTYVLEHVNLAAGKLLKVNYSGVYYGHDAGKVTGPVELENETNYNMRLTEDLNDATIIFTMPTPFADNWTLTIGNGGVVEHKPYYFAGDLNRWFDKSFEGGSKGGIDTEIFEAEKDKWAFEYVGDVEGLEGTGWYKLDFKAQNLGTLVGQFQIIDRGSWDNGAEVYSHNPKVTNYEDASGFARYINSPITRDMIKSGKVLTKDGTPGIVKANGSNFHLDCNGVNNAVIYFLPGDNPKMIVRGEPTDYFVFYSAEGKSGGNNAVSMEIVNGKPNEVNYYLPGVKNLKNYTSANASTEGPHMNIAPVELTKINFSDANFDQTTEFASVFGASENVGNLTLGDFVTMIKTENKLPNGTSLDGRGEVYVIKIPNGFEYAAGTKFAVKFHEAFAASEIGSTSTIVANHLYFFNDELHVMLNVDNYEAGAEAENAYVKLYYRVYGYDDAYNTVVVNSDGSTTELYKVGTEIGYTEKGTETQKTAGWVEYNKYGVMPESFTGAPAGNWHYATEDSGDIYGLDPKFGNFFVQFKIVTGPNTSQAANGPAKVEGQEYTLYLPEKTLALNQEGFYNFNGQDLYQKFEGGYTTTGVEDVFEDQIVEEGVDAEPIFFNLQGQRVVNPEKGMYIVVKGNKTYKVMIK